MFAYKPSRPAHLLLMVIAIILSCSNSILAQQKRLDKQLILAVKANNTKRVKSLLAQGASPNAKWHNPDTLTGRYKIWADRGASETITGKKPPSVLMISLGNLAGDDPEWYTTRDDLNEYVSKRVEITIALVLAGADIHFRDADTKETPLMLAARYQNLECVKSILKKGARVEDEDSFGFTALLWAMNPDKDNSSIVEFLLKNKANPNHKFRDGSVPLCCVLGPGRLKYVRLLVKYGANVNAKNKKGETVLQQMKKRASSFVPIQEDVIQLVRELGGRD